MSGFPQIRLRRLRRTPALRRSFAELRLDPADLVAPLFVKDGIDEPARVGSMPGVVQHTRDSVRAEVKRLHALGVSSAILFGVPARKDAEGAAGWDSRGPVPAAIRAIREDLGDAVVIWADTCLCEYTTHGHCGPLTPHGDVDNDRALAGYARQAVVQGDAGADFAAPSGMMDGQVAAIRGALDDAGHTAVGIVAYAAKFDSAFYGPFREAAESAPSFGDRSAYQLAAANRREARREVALDVAEGADVVMVKPALPCLDIITDVRAAHDVPLAAYHVSGEYAMVKAAAERGWIDGGRVMLESLVAVRRAGADLVVSYAAAEVAEALQDG